MAVSFSYFEYQLITLCLAVCMCGTLGILELYMRRYNILPFSFSIFHVKKRRIYCYDIDITLASAGKIVRKEAKMMIRIVLLISLAYLWSTCVIETTTYTGGSLPHSECASGSDCFVTKLSFDTFFSRPEPANCTDIVNSPDSIPSTAFINCLKVVKPDIMAWMKHLAIAYAFALLLIRVFEALLWLSTRSILLERVLYILSITYTISVIVLFFLGLLTPFVSSFVSFCIMLCLPVIMKLAACASHNLRSLRKLQYVQNQAKASNELVSQLKDQEIILDNSYDTLHAIQTQTMLHRDPGPPPLEKKSTTSTV